MTHSRLSEFTAVVHPWLDGRGRVKPESHVAQHPAYLACQAGC